MNKHLRNILLNFFQHRLKGRRVVLLDVPNYINPGDQLIWEGTLQMLKDIGIKPEYTASVHFFNSKKIKPEHVILMQGGGNFGDLYPKHQLFRERILRLFPDNHVYILPVSLHFKKEESVKSNSRAFNHHKKLTICARDETTFMILNRFYTSADIQLLPDMAFCIQKLPVKKINEKKIITLLARNDNERDDISSAHSLAKELNIPTTDWPTYHFGKFAYYIHFLSLSLNICIMGLLKVFNLHWNEKHDVYGLLKYNSKELQISLATDIISNSLLLITDRLHGYILACILCIPTIILDNNYGKNARFYNTWLRSSKSSALAADNQVVIMLIKRYLN